jgi:hypothetical protein
MIRADDAGGGGGVIRPAIAAMIGAADAGGPAIAVVMIGADDASPGLIGPATAVVVGVGRHRHLIQPHLQANSLHL